MDGINIEDNEYNPIKVFIDSDTKDNDNILDTSIVSNPTVLLKLVANASETNSDFNYICGPCIGSKSTQIVI